MEEDDENLSPLKRPRSDDDYKQAYDELNIKFMALSKENAKLKRTMENLLAKFDAKFSSEECLPTEEEMVVDEPLPKEKSKKNKKAKSGAAKRA